MQTAQSNFGFPQLLKEWKQLLSLKGLKEDLFAGSAVAFMAIPLCLAIALASGVEPELGLITGIVASTMCGLFGGTPLAVSGPAIAMSLLIASVVQQHGMGGLLFVGLGCGILQMLTGAFGFGRAIRFVPLPVIAGFTAGIGALVLIGQLPRALGLPPPDQSHIFDVVTHIRDLLHETRASSLAVAGGTLVLSFLIPKVLPKLPAPFLAVAIPTLIVGALGIQTRTLGFIPHLIPAPKLPSIPNGNYLELMGTTLILYCLASMETLASSTAIAKILKVKKHNTNQELIGQGLANIATACFGGIPATTVIARSALNIQSGAKTRRSVFLQGIILLILVYVGAPFIAKIPVAALAGILLSISLRMLHPREFLEFLSFSRSEAFIYMVTFLVIVFIDLLAGIQMGVVAALVISMVRLSRAKTNVQNSSATGPSQISVQGALTFLSGTQIDSIREEIAHLDLSRGLVLDLSKIKSMDASGASGLIDFLDHLQKNNTRFALTGLATEYRKVLVPLDTTGTIAKHIAANESEVLTILGDGENIAGLDRLIYGVEKFRREFLDGYGVLFEKLATGQSPHTLFITCSDSRISPNLITSSDPGELFVVRNVGNIIPLFGEDETPAEGAAVEFAIGVLGVKEIVVCGHSGCGAMKAVLSGDIFSKESRKKLPSVATWLENAQGIKDQLPSDATPDQAAELNSLIQLENLKTYPIIQEKLRKGEIRLHAWYYNIGKAELEEWDETQKLFVTIGSKAKRSLEKRMEAGVQFQVPFASSSNSNPNSKNTNKKK